MSWKNQIIIFFYVLVIAQILFTRLTPTNQTKPTETKRKSFSLKKNKDSINFIKQNNAIVPNLIHSLDALSLFWIVKIFFHENSKENNNLNFFSIHDCFAVTANNIPNLIKIIKLI